MKIGDDMKNKRDYLVCFSIVFIVVVSVLAIYTFVNAKRTLNFVVDESINDELAQIKESIDDMEKNACSENLLKYYNYVNDTVYNGKTKLNDLYYYMSSTDLSNTFNNIKTECKMPEEKLKEYSISNRYLTTISLKYEVLVGYLYQYELNFTDPMKNDINKASVESAYRLLKNNEVELLKDYIRIMEEI